jgi:hypothetical protein
LILSLLCTKNALANNEIDFRNFIEHCYAGAYAKEQYCPELDITSPMVCKGLAIHSLPAHDRAKGRGVAMSVDTIINHGAVDNYFFSKADTKQNELCVDYFNDYKNTYQQLLNKL